MKAIYEYGGTRKVLTFDFADNGIVIRNGFSVSLMETVFKLVLAQSGVSANIYLNRPKSLPEKVSDFAVVWMQGTLSDLSAFGECTVNVALFAKDASGFKNSNKLSAMQDKVLRYLPLSISVTDDNGVMVEEYLIDKTPDILGDAPDDYGFHCRMILLKTTIKVI